MPTGKPPSCTRPAFYSPPSLPASPPPSLPLLILTPLPLPLPPLTQLQGHRGGFEFNLKEAEEKVVVVVEPESLGGTDNLAGLIE